MAGCAAVCQCGGAGTDDSCQGCFDDIYDQCGGCDQDGFGFDTKLGEGIKATAKGMGCNGAAQAAPAMLLVLAAVVGRFFD